MTTGEAIKILTNAGYEEKNQRGSHKKFNNGTHSVIIVYHRSQKETINKKTEKIVKEISKSNKNK